MCKLLQSGRSSLIKKFNDFSQTALIIIDLRLELFVLFYRIFAEIFIIINNYFGSFLLS